MFFIPALLKGWDKFRYGELMKILIVSGFLGSGKTSLINKIMRIKKDDYVILENEYATVNVDGDLLENDREKIWEMTEGCVCCSMSKEIGDDIITIENTFRPNFLIIEPTGVGKLSNIIKKVEKVCYEKIKLLHPITLVDASVFLKYYKEKDPNYLDQIMCSKYLIISKTDDMRTEEIMGIKQKLREINKKANILLANELGEEDKFWDDILTNDLDDSLDFSEMSEENSEFEHISFKNVSEKNIDNLFMKLNLVLRGVFGEILRIKGFLPINGQWTKLDSVGIKYKLETIEEKKESKLVIIGKDLKKSYLEDLFVKDKLP